MGKAEYWFQTFFQYLSIAQYIMHSVPLKSPIKNKNYFLCIWVFCLHRCLVTMEFRRHWIPESCRYVCLCAIPCVCWETNLGPLQLPKSQFFSLFLKFVFWGLKCFSVMHFFHVYASPDFLHNITFPLWEAIASV